MENSHRGQITVINFKVHDIYASLDIDHIDKVIALPKIEPVPAGPIFLIGLLNLGGTVIPIIDLSIKLKINQMHAYTINTPILICKNSQNKFAGIIVDAVMDVATVRADMLQKYEECLSGDEIVTACIKFPDMISLLLNIDHLVRDGGVEGNAKE